MKIRQTEDGTALVFPEGHEFKAFKLWLHEFGGQHSYYHDTTAGCYVLKNLNVKILEKAGFNIEMLKRKQFSTMVADILARGYPEDEGDV